METKARQPKRTCPVCGHAVHVERRQTLKCSHCPVRGILTIKEDIIWTLPALAEARPEVD